MNYLKVILFITKYECKKFFSDKFNAFLIILLPSVFALLATYIWNVGMSKDRQYQILIYCEEQDWEICNEIGARYENTVVTNEEWAQEDILTGQNKIALVINDKIRFYYNSSSLMYTEALYIAEEIANEIVLTRMSSEIDKVYCEMKNANMKDLSTITQSVKEKTKHLMSFVFVFVFGVLEFSIESQVREQFFRKIQNGSFDSIRLSPLSTRQIIIGKKIFTSTLSVISIVLAVCSSIICLRLFCVEEYLLLSSLLQCNVWKLLPFLFLLLLVSCLLVSLNMIQSISEAHNRLFNMVSVLIAISTSALIIIPQYISYDGMNYIPIMNVSPVLWECLTGQFNVKPYLCSIILIITGSVGLTHLSEQMIDRRY